MPSALNLSSPKHGREHLEDPLGTNYRWEGFEVRVNAHEATPLWPNLVVRAHAARVGTVDILGEHGTQVCDAIDELAPELSSMSRWDSEGESFELFILGTLQLQDPTGALASEPLKQYSTAYFNHSLGKVTRLIAPALNYGH